MSSSNCQEVYSITNQKMGVPRCPSHTPAAPVPEVVVSNTLSFWRQSGKRHWVTIEGQSMLPLIQHGDRVLVTHGIARIRRGSVVVFRRERKLIAHRLLRLRRDRSGQFVTKGDNATQFDEPVAQDNVLGHVVAVERNGQIFVLETKAWRSIGWVLATATLFVAASYARVRSIKRRTLGSSSLPGARLVHRCSGATLRTVMGIVTWLCGVGR